MRIGIDITYAAKREGTGTYIRNLLTALAQHPEIEWITFARPRPRYVRRLPRPLARIVLGILSIIWLQLVLPLQARRQRLDVFHAPAFIAPLFLACPCVLTLLDATEYAVAKPQDRFWNLYVRVLATLGARRAARVITISQHAARDLQHFFHVPHNKLRITYLGVAPHFRRLAPTNTTRSLHEYVVDEPYLLFVGAGDARKNYHTLLDALRLLRAQGQARLPLVITGKVTPEFRQLASDDTAHGGVDVRFLGFVPEQTLVALYNRAVLLAYPSHHEGFGLPVLEAMACGCPVICANTSALPEIAGDAALLIDPDNPISLAAAIAAVLSEPTCAAQLRAKGLQRASGFTWAHTAATTLAIYREICQHRDPVRDPIDRAGEKVHRRGRLQPGHGMP